MASRRIKLTVAIAAAFIYSGVLLDVTGSALAQRRTSRSRPRPATPPARIDYSKFSHATSKHQQECKTCHRVPAGDWQKTSGFPDVADYPDHDACVSCHRQQFFKGDKPPICSICHSRVSPRNEARFEFRHPSRPRQFTIDFPHDRHQDVIAGTSPLKRDELVVGRRGLPPLRLRPMFVKAAFADLKTYNSCAICHVTRDEPWTLPASWWVDSYVPDKLTFKTVPMDHAACFNCHWNAEEPVNSNCGGCHKLSTPRAAFQDVQRISMKFKHDGGGETRNHVAECTTCHINITRASSLRGLKPDVPITACTECHNREGLRLDLSKELEAIDKDRGFVCVYCHTSNVGKRDPPASHYSIVRRAPQLRGD